jgi:hypothetical protein
MRYAFAIFVSGIFYGRQVYGTTNFLSGHSGIQPAILTILVIQYLILVI